MRHTVSIREMTFAIIVLRQYRLTGLYRTKPGRNENVCNECNRDLLQGVSHVGDCRIKRAEEIAEQVFREQNA